MWLVTVALAWYRVIIQLLAEKPTFGGLHCYSTPSTAALRRHSGDCASTTELWTVHLGPFVCQTKSARASSWTTYLHNNVSKISHLPSVNAQKHGVNFCNSENLCGTLLDRIKLPSAYPFTPSAPPWIRPSFASIADMLREQFAKKDYGSTKLHI